MKWEEVCSIRISLPSSLYCFSMLDKPKPFFKVALLGCRLLETHKP